MSYALQFQDQIHGHWETIATFPSVNAAETATNKFGQLLTECYDDTRIIDSAHA